MSDSDSELFIGLMSGTSADGIDAALVDFGHDVSRISLRLGRTYPWPPALRKQLLYLGQGASVVDLDMLGALDARVGQAFADAAIRLLVEAGESAARIKGLGSHGQTIRHRPAVSLPFTWQIGDPHRIAEMTGITTVADFRRRDVAAGGQGAPLVPALHTALFRSKEESRAVLNLGGIANITLLPVDGPVTGFDTGPANALSDAWCLQYCGQPYDRDAAFARQGRVDAALLERLLSDPWFSLAPPKSTGREQFHLQWLEEQLSGKESPTDVQATLVELSAVTVAMAVQRYQPTIRRLLVCGGGVHNPLLMQRLAVRLPGCHVTSTADYGVDPDFVEAMAFAWLARETMMGRPGNVPEVTGASGLRVLGAIYPVRAS